MKRKLHRILFVGIGFGKFDLLPGGEVSTRKKLVELFRPRGKQ